jgi:hypothetical protein
MPGYNRLVSETGETAPRRGFFSRLFGKSAGDEPAKASMSKEESLAAYIIREHRSGRPLDDILDDPYLKNRATEEQRLRLLDRPDVIRCVGEDTAAMAAEHVRAS